MAKTSLNFLMNYRRFFAVLSIYMMALFYPFLVSVINFPPNFGGLKEIKVKIIHASMMHPNLLALNEDGVVEEFDFPSSSYDLFRGFGGVNERPELIFTLNQGCVGSVLVDREKFIILHSRFRVWSLNCGSVHAGYEQRSASYKKIFFWGLLVYIPAHVFACFILALHFYGDRRKVWTRKSL